MKPITIWERNVLVDIKKKIYEWQHNHIEDGWLHTLIVPKPICRYQERAWKNAYWRKAYGYLNIDNVVQIFGRQ